MIIKSVEYNKEKDHWTAVIESGFFIRKQRDFASTDGYNWYSRKGDSISQSLKGRLHNIISWLNIVGFKAVIFD